MYLGNVGGGPEDEDHRSAPNWPPPQLLLIAKHPISRFYGFPSMLPLLEQVGSSFTLGLQKSIPELLHLNCYTMLHLPTLVLFSRFIVCC